MNKFIEKRRNFYNFVKGAEIVQDEFGYYSLEKWQRQGYVKDMADLRQKAGLDGESVFSMGSLGWCEAAFFPVFETEVLEDRGEYELVRDFAGRSVLYFKGRRSGFMPEYMDHPVKDMNSFLELEWRLDPQNPERINALKERLSLAKAASSEGKILCQNIVGGYMYLRSLMGPEGLLYMFYDDPALIHACMKAWLKLADSVTAFYQSEISFDEVFLAEDICYNNGPLISFDMMDEFLFPYYKQLLSNIRKRQNGKAFHIQIDTDGDCRPVIDQYREIGMTYMSPFEVASGCDVVEIRKKYPDLLIRGGIDKRILSAGKEAIKREVDRIMPFMKEQGGYIPTCDHGVPSEVDFEDYMYYRELMKNF